MANEIKKATTTSVGLASLKSKLDSESIQAQFYKALGDNKDVFAASIVDLYTNDKQLQECDTNKILVEALKAATLKLPLNKALGFAYIVVYKNNVKQEDGTWLKVPTPTFMLGFRGYIQLAMRTGQYETFNADVVYEGEMRGFDKLSGRIDLKGERVSDKVVGYFCYFKLLNGFEKMIYMTVHEMAEYAKKYSPSVKGTTTVEQLEKLAQSKTVSKQVGWEGNFNDMAIKTVIRRLLSKYGYLSIEMQAAGDPDDMEFGYDENNAELANTKTLILDADAYEQVGSGEQEQEAGDAQQNDAPEEPGY